MDWNIGLIVGPSGSGKTSLGRKVFHKSAFYRSAGWPKDAPVIDDIAPGGTFTEVAGALSRVGLGNVPAWLRPHHVLSNGEKFRADLARIICDAPKRVVVDEFTSVIDRQIARVGHLRSGRHAEGRAGKPFCCPVITILSTGSWTPRPGSSPGGVFNDGRTSMSTSMKPTGDFGRFLSRITT